MKGMKTLKKLLSVTLCAALIGSAAAILPAATDSAASGITASAADDDNPASSFRYQKNDDGGITIDKFIGSESYVFIPSEIDGKPVTNIQYRAFGDCTNVIGITIPDSVTKIGGFAFSDCTNLESIIIGNSVTSIGSYAFRNCTSLKSISIPDSVTSIYEWAFYGCTNLKSITISDSMTSIEKGVFYQCSSLESIIIPESVTIICESAFRECNSLESIIIPDSVTNIGAYAFDNCSNLGELKIGNGVTSIDRGTFKSCTSLTNVTIGNSVTSIGREAFEGCRNLSRITIPGNVTNIGYLSFSNCEYLRIVIIGDGVTTIDTNAFSQCNLCYVTIPDSVTSIKYGAFYDSYNMTIHGKSGSYAETYAKNNNISFLECYETASSDDTDSPMFEYSISDETVSIAGYLGENSSTDISIPSEIDGKKVKSIGDYAFYYCSSLTSITIPDSVTSIGDCAFSECTSLTSITIPDSVTSIGESAFCVCVNLTSINLPDSMTSISDSLFFNCLGLSSVIIPDGVTNIGDYAFQACSRLTNITIPDSVTTIGGKAFEGTLWYKNQPDGIVCAGNIMCEYKGKMPDNTSITIPDGVTSISPYAFQSCSGLTNITIPDSVTNIGHCAFMFCSSLTSITIPDGVKNIDYSTFEGCSSLENVEIPDSVTSIDYWAFSRCSSLKSITIPDSVTSIGYCAFAGCSSDFTIYGVAGSYAETYANDNEYGFVAISNLKNTSTISTEKLYLGKKLTITGAAKGGTAPYTYAFYYKRSTNTKWNVLGTEFGTATAATLKPTTAADYDIKVVVKDANGSTAEKLFKLTVTPALTNTSWVNAEKVQIGDDIRVEGAAEGGEGGYKYAFYFKRSTNSKWNKIGTEFGTKTYGVTVPKAAADYDMKVIVKDNAGNTAEKIFKVTVVESLPLTNVSYLNAYDVPVGKTVTAKGRFVGGAKPCTYEFYFKRSANTKWNKLSYGNEKGTYAKFTPTAAAEYDIKVIAIDSKGAKAEKIMKLTAT